MFLDYLAGLLRDNQALLFFVVLGFGYLLGKIKIKGDMGLAMKLQSLLA